MTKIHLCANKNKSFTGLKFNPRQKYFTEKKSEIEKNL